MNTTQKKQLTYATIFFLFICVSYYLFIVFPRLGKIEVEVITHPNNASIYIDGNKSKPGKTYLKEGKYTFSAKADGWIDDEVEVSVSTELATVVLLPTPSSTDAKLIAKEAATEREGLGSMAANTRGLNIRNDNPFLEKLPYSDISGPFKIDYGFNKKDAKTPYIIVSYSTPNGRQEAIAWLEDQDVDITSIEIAFSDFVNPIEGKERSHE